VSVLITFLKVFCFCFCQNNAISLLVHICMFKILSIVAEIVKFSCFKMLFPSSLIKLSIVCIT
jgi:hypothetical protein